MLAEMLGIVSLLLWEWLNVEVGCERKSVGSRGVEPCHPVVTSHTCPLFTSEYKELTFVYPDHLGDSAVDQVNSTIMKIMFLLKQPLQNTVAIVNLLNAQISMSMTVTPGTHIHTPEHLCE